MSRNDRFPFHFNDSDLEARRAEFLKRFGLRSDEDRSMFYETPSFSSFGSNWPDWPERFRRGGHFDDADWRNRTWHTQTGSEPGSPRVQHRMHTPAWSSCDADSVPIKVIHENSPDKNGADDESETSSQGSHCSSNHSGHSQRKMREPRVHHIPIMVEPRDGSVSSGYASDGVTDEARLEHEASRTSAGAPVHSGASDSRMSGASANQGHVDIRGGGFHNQSSRNADNEATNMKECETESHKSHMRRVPIQVQSSPSAARNVGSNSSYSEHPSNRFSGQRSPIRSFSDNSVEKGSPNGKSMSKQRSKSSTPEPSQSKKQFGGPHVTRIPVNVSSGSSNNDRAETQSKDTTPPPPPQHSQPPTSDALAKILVVQKDVAILQKEVESFSGATNDKYFRFLDEMLTRSMLKLDNVDTEGKEEIRAARKTVVREIESCIATLESKARRNAGKVKPETNGQADAEMEDGSGKRAIPDETLKTDENEKLEREMTGVEVSASEVQPSEESIDEGAEVGHIVEKSEQTPMELPVENVEPSKGSRVAENERMEADSGERTSEDATRASGSQDCDVEATKL